MKPISSYLLLNGLRFHYLNWGGLGRPVVLLHGLASNARIWDLVAPRLASEVSASSPRTSAATA